ncbi:MAG: prolipoprotein diacylglyceryl transferase [Acidobacteria bacterium]|nr:prolipoprotein diacylglyceryl transferase [Acidobacteriota bacterium]
MNGPVVHAAFELLAYLTGFALSRRAWAREKRVFAAQPDSGWIAVAAILGAALGSKLLFLLQFPDFVCARFPSAEALLGGKTIVGGLLGGLAGVEIAKARLGVADSTGDLFTLPVIGGLVVGRLGCLAAGLVDETFGLPTSLPWGWDFGDGVRRHPTPLYEIAFLLAFLAALRVFAPRLVHAGDTFRIFMASYLAFRVAVDFLKPPFGPVASAVEAALPRARLYAGLTAIQIAALCGVLYDASVFLRRILRRPA